MICCRIAALIYYSMGSSFVVVMILVCCTVVAPDTGMRGESHGGGTEVRLLLEARGDVHVVRIANRRDGSRCDTNL